MNRAKVLIMGAAGRDFHNFNTVYKDDPEVEVVCFTAAQIPNIDQRVYPPELSGDLYPSGIPIFDEDDLTGLISEFNVDEVVFSYSDVSHDYVMHRASKVLRKGANFMLLGAGKTMIESRKPVVAIGAVRTGCGKSQTTRRVTKILRDLGKNVVVIRHPMPYGDLVKQKVQRFTRIDDMKQHHCTIEEMEEFEHLLVRGVVVFAGVDYEAILHEAEKEAEIIVWDGGNNDMPFYRPDLFFVLADPHRPGHEVQYYPGESNLRMADVVIINKVDTAVKKNVEIVKSNIARVNPDATLIEAASPVSVEDASAIEGKRVLVVEDGPTLTHGGMKYGAGMVAAKKYGAKEIVDPRPWTVGFIQEIFQDYPEIGKVLPAIAYGDRQKKELQDTIDAIDCDSVIVATPIDLRRVITINKPSVRVMYELEELGTPTLIDILTQFCT